MSLSLPQRWSLFGLIPLVSCLPAPLSLDLDSGLQLAGRMHDVSAGRQTQAPPVQRMAPFNRVPYGTAAPSSPPLSMNEKFKEDALVNARQATWHNSERARLENQVNEMDQHYARQANHHFEQLKADRKATVTGTEWHQGLDGRQQPVERSLLEEAKSVFHHGVHLTRPTKNQRSPTMVTQSKEPEEREKPMQKRMFESAPYGLRHRPAAKHSSKALSPAGSVHTEGDNHTPEPFLPRLTSLTLKTIADKHGAKGRRHRHAAEWLERQTQGRAAPLTQLEELPSHGGSEHSGNEDQWRQHAYNRAQEAIFHHRVQQGIHERHSAAVRASAGLIDEPLTSIEKNHKE